MFVFANAEGFELRRGAGAGGWHFFTFSLLRFFVIGFLRGVELCGVVLRVVNYEADDDFSLQTKLPFMTSTSP